MVNFLFTCLIFSIFFILTFENLHSASDRENQDQNSKKRKLIQTDENKRKPTKREKNDLALKGTRKINTYFMPIIEIPDEESSAQTSIETRDTTIQTIFSTAIEDLRIESAPLFTGLTSSSKEIKPAASFKNPFENVDKIIAEFKTNPLKSSEIKPLDNGRFLARFEINSSISHNAFRYFSDEESAQEWLDFLQQHQANHLPLTQQQKKARREKRFLMKRL